MGDAGSSVAAVAAGTAGGSGVDTALLLLFCDFGRRLCCFFGRLSITFGFGATTAGFEVVAAFLASFVANRLAITDTLEPEVRMALFDTALDSNLFAAATLAATELAPPPPPPPPDRLLYGRGNCEDTLAASAGLLVLRGLLAEERPESARARTASGAAA